MSAIFGAFFQQVKKRFKEILAPHVKYVDGMTPEQLAAELVTVPDTQAIVEDDLEKQDRQTNHALIQIERKIYLELGANEQVVDFYMNCHHKWRWKGHGTQGRWDAMRLTGQCTTAIGNAIVNLITHSRLMLRNKGLVTKMLVLGDDNILFSTRALDVSGHGTVVSKYYNMVSKVNQYKEVGEFLSMLVYLDGDGVLRLCPNFKRMRHRFSVSNYTYSGVQSLDKLKGRVLSYCFMLGSVIDGSVTIAKEINSKVTIPDWYSLPGAIRANSVYHDCNEEQTSQHIGKLLYMMQECAHHQTDDMSRFKKTFKHWSDKKFKK
jgi:hypothetical protein